MLKRVSEEYYVPGAHAALARLEKNTGVMKEGRLGKIINKEKEDGLGIKVL